MTDARPVDLSTPPAVHGRTRRIEVRTPGTQEWRLALLLRPHPFASSRYALVKLGGQPIAMVPWFAISETRRAGSSSAPAAPIQGA